MTRWLNTLQPWGAFLLRLALGAAMIFHGWDKVIPARGLRGDPLAALKHFSHTVASLGLPPWLGYVSALTEFLGGILLLLGLFTRFVSFFLTINMAVAVLVVDRHRGYQASEYAIALFAIAVMLLFYGPGAIAVDRRLGFS